MHNNGLKFFLIFGDVVDNNVLDQSLEGLEKIISAGCDIRTAMVIIIISQIYALDFFRNFCM